MIAEELRPGFIKYRLVEPGEWPWTPFLHRIWLPETHAHDHPGNMTVNIVRGPGYIEEQFVETRSGLKSMGRVRRKLGDRFDILGETIHRIVDTFGEETWSLVEHEPNRREVRVFEVAC